VDHLQTVSHKLAEAMYSANAEQPGAAPGGSNDRASGGASKEEDVVDAEFVDVDDDKKS
jgi:hypothetical protein